MRLVAFLGLASCVLTASAQAPADPPLPPLPPPLPPFPEADFVYIMSVDLGWPDATWTDARDRCASRGWYLARILSQRDQDLMVARLLGFSAGVAQGIFRKPPVEDDCDDWPCGMWFGANDIRSEGEWEWTNGQRISVYSTFGAFDSVHVRLAPHACPLLPSN